ncbi:MAG: flagellar biosynthetic protein FliO [Terriglobales bacterium]
MATPSLHSWDLKRWLASPRKRRARRLRLQETLSLGDRRFVALLVVDGRELLIGATPHSLTLLDDLGGGLEDFPPPAARGRDLQ